MNDRDRLEADLRAIEGMTWEGATRVLIALGWTRLDVTPTQLSEREVTSDRAACNHIGQPRLDEERLARALDGIDMADWWEEYPVVEGGIVVAHETEINTDKAAAAIAKAYREDTDAD